MEVMNSERLEGKTKRLDSRHTCTDVIVSVVSVTWTSSTS